MSKRKNFAMNLSNKKLEEIQNNVKLAMALHKDAKPKSYYDEEKQIKIIFGKSEEELNQEEASNIISTTK